MTPTPGGRIRDAQIILELTSGGARGSGGHEIDRPKPVPQWLSSLVKDGVGRDRRLMQTTLALIFSSGRNKIGLIMVTARTAKAARPFALDDISDAVALRAEASSELSGRHGCIQESPPLYNS